MSDSQEPSQNYLIAEVGDDATRAAQLARDRSLANLKPFPPGTSGNPVGRANGGAYVAEWISAMLMCDEQGNAKYSRDDLMRFVRDRKSPPAKVVAAQEILTAMASRKKYVKVWDRENEEWIIKPGGSDPEPGRAMERIMNRTVGLPVRRVDITHEKRERSPDEVRKALEAKLAGDPMLAEMLGVMLQMRQLQMQEDGERNSSARGGRSEVVA